MERGGSTFLLFIVSVTKGILVQYGRFLKVSQGWGLGSVLSGWNVHIFIRESFEARHRTGREKGFTCSGRTTLRGRTRRRNPHSGIPTVDHSQDLNPCPLSWVLSPEEYPQDTVDFVLLEDKITIRKMVPIQYRGPGIDFEKREGNTPLYPSNLSLTHLQVSSKLYPKPFTPDVCHIEKKKGCRNRPSESYSLLRPLILIYSPYSSPSRLLLFYSPHSTRGPRFFLVLCLSGTQGCALLEKVVLSRPYPRLKSKLFYCNRS